MNPPDSASPMAAWQAARAQVLALVEAARFPLAASELRDLALNDFGLGNFAAEGFAFVDLLRSPRLRITFLVLLPGQTLPEHRHPPYDGEPGKEETLRVLHGAVRLYVPGPAASDRPPLLPPGKESYYTARHELVLQPGEQFSVAPNLPHWFQGGPQGGVALTFQNRVDETKNLFTDPRSTGCPIKLDAL